MWGCVCGLLYVFGMLFDCVDYGDYVGCVVFGLFGFVV